MADSTVVRVPRSLEDELTKADRSQLRVTSSGTASTPATPPPAPCPPRQTTAAIDKTLSTASNLSKLHPTGTVLAFQYLTPSFSNKGVCYASNVYLTSALIILCSLSCFVLSFTDSLVGRDGKLYHGIATWRGFYVFNYGGTEEERGKVFELDLRSLRMRPVDFVHAFFSMLVFLTVAFSNANVQSCFFSGGGVNTKELLTNLPLGVGFLSTIVFMIFPTSRRGVGYADLTPPSQ